MHPEHLSSDTFYWPNRLCNISLFKPVSSEVGHPWEDLSQGLQLWAFQLLSVESDLFNRNGDFLWGRVFFKGCSFLAAGTKGKAPGSRIFFSVVMITMGSNSS